MEISLIAYSPMADEGGAKGKSLSAGLGYIQPVMRTGEVSPVRMRKDKGEQGEHGEIGKWIAQSDGLELV